MHRIITLYSRAYLTAAFMDVPADPFNHADNMSDNPTAPPVPVPRQRLFSRVAAWLRDEWEAIREEQRNGSGERVYWPPDL